MTASQFPTDPPVLCYTASDSRLVPCQLFSYGKHGFALRRQVWHKQGNSLDDTVTEYILLQNTNLSSRATPRRRRDARAAPSLPATVSMTLQKARIKYHGQGTEHITNSAINGMDSFEASAARTLPHTLMICTEPSVGCRLCRPRLLSLFVHVQSALWLHIEP